MVIYTWVDILPWIKTIKIFMCSRIFDIDVENDRIKCFIHDIILLLARDRYGF